MGYVYPKQKYSVPQIETEVQCVPQVIMVGTVSNTANYGMGCFAYLKIRMAKLKKGFHIPQC
jgi:hypothetical protein